jgi:hypothetical protein
MGVADSSSSKRRKENRMLTMARTSAGLLAVALLLGSVSPVRVLRLTPKAPEVKTGIKVGQKAPEFRLRDQNDRERSLDEFLNNGTVALVFYRSASW